MTLAWYALQSHTHKEEYLWNLLLTQGFETYYPRLHVKPVNPRSRKVLPYFPGYLFVQANLVETGISLFQYMPHSLGLVSFGDEPSVVPDLLIQTLRERLSALEQQPNPPEPQYKPGQVVEIRSGPLAGYEAIFDTRLSGSDRVRVLLKMLNHRNLPVELDQAQIRRTNRRNQR